MDLNVVYLGGCSMWAWEKCVPSMLTGLPVDSVVKNLPASSGDASSIPESGRSPGEVNVNPFHYSCLGNPMDSGT